MAADAMRKNFAEQGSVLDLSGLRLTSAPNCLNFLLI